MGLVLDNDLIRVSEEFSVSPSVPEILWNFSRYTTVHVSPSSRTLTSIYNSLLLRAHIRPHFNATHFKAQA
jgi:hypothetical protein